MLGNNNTAVVYAVLAAALYAVNAPFSKILLNYVEPTMMASFLYLGAGIGLFVYGMLEKSIGKKVNREPLTAKELPYTIAMVVLDIIAPILLMFGIKLSSAASASLLNNFEIVATSFIALVIFKELISKRLWIAIFLVTVASIILSFEGMGNFDFNYGSLFVLGACLCWGFENNCTKMGSVFAFAWVCCLRSQYMFLYYGTERPGCRKNQCILFNSSVPWRSVRNVVS